MKDGALRMTLTREQEKKLLGGLALIFALLVLYRIFTAEGQKTAPLTYGPGSVASSPVRRGIASPAAESDPLLVFLNKREERFPGVGRDIFRMANPVSKPKTPPEPLGPPLPPVPEKTPQEIAAEQSRADLQKFHFLGYLTEKDNTLFLSKEGELFIVKIGDTVLKNYKVKGADKDQVTLLDTVTKVEVRIELTGGTEPAQSGQRPMPPPPPFSMPGFPQPPR